jgi:hypothetical protein
MSIITFSIIPCRWCGTKNIPDLETGEFKKKCKNNSCRRQTWNLSDAEIKANKTISMKALLNNHKDGKVKLKKRPMKNINEDFVVKLKAREKTVVCKQCELLFGNEAGLKRHQERRGHVD